MKNILWILLAIIVLAILLWLSRDGNTVPHAIIIDTLGINIHSNSNKDAEHHETFSATENQKHLPNEIFLGKSMSECLTTMSEWPDAQLLEITRDGMPVMRFRVNNRIHELKFIDDICVSDEILKK
jgi:hypothetical protein